MAPKKRGSDGEEKKAKSNSKSVSSRVTRSSSRRLKVNSVADSSELPKTKKAKSSSYKADHAQGKSGKISAEGAAAKITVDADDGSVTKTIVIEHCKQCNSFKTRAIQVKDGLENGLSGITVLINPEKPRRGCFEIREESGEKFISLLDMKRPFTPMKALDMDKVISDILDKIK